MSKTLFFYLFKDLLRIFAMATGALAGIMSFAGLLRPLTETGLDLGQVSRILRYMSPAMTTYSLPVAALFATTVVYGRFSADNELTAMRAGGVGYISLRRFSIALPAIVLGLIAALVSLILLCFVVPIYSLKVEQVIYSNVARVIVTKVEKEHEIDFNGGGNGDLHVFAESARQVPPDADHPSDQAVELVGPTIVTYENSDPDHPNLKVPKEFWMARTALVTISRGAGGVVGGSANLNVRLIGGTRFPRQFGGNVQAGVADTTFGPIEIPSLINENVKLMNVGELQDLAAHPAKSEKVQIVLHNIDRQEEDRTYLQSLAAQINVAATQPEQSGADHLTDSAGISPAIVMTTQDNPQSGIDRFIVGGAGVTARVDNFEIILTGPATNPDSTSKTSPAPKPGQTVQFRQMHGSQETLWAIATEAHIRARADALNHQMAVSITLYNTHMRTGDESSDRMSFIRSFTVPMPANIAAIEHKPLSAYAHDPMLTPTDGMFLEHEQIVVANSVRSELHSRASFSLSCLVLVMVGCALGIMFRSGNFLTAFAVSFIPALLVIVLIVCGQQVATHVPYKMHIHNPLPTALIFIWIGNFAVLVAAIVLTIRLQRR